MNEMNEDHLAATSVTNALSLLDNFNLESAPQHDDDGSPSAAEPSPCDCHVGDLSLDFNLKRPSLCGDAGGHACESCDISFEYDHLRGSEQCEHDAVMMLLF